MKQKETNMADVGMLFSKENIKTIENIFKVEFEKQEKNIDNLISANLKITMDEINKTQDEMKKPGKEVADLKQSLELRENFLEEKVKKLDEEHVNLENQCNKLYNNSLGSEYFYNKLVDLEDKSRRNNLRIDEIAEWPNESWERCKEQLQNMFKEKLGLDNV